MNEEQIFLPPKRSGWIFHAGIIFLSLSLGLLSLWMILRIGFQPQAIIFVLIALFSLVLIPILVYRIYALANAYYALERDGIYIHWGLRIEEIPMVQVEWVTPASELEVKLPMPWITIPGSILGVRKFPDGTPIEYMASSAKNLVLIKTGQKIFGISPKEADRFLDSFQRVIEMGSISPIQARSVYPTFLFARVWADRFARILIILSILLNTAIWVFVSVITDVEKRVQERLLKIVWRSPL